MDGGAMKDGVEYSLTGVDEITKKLKALSVDMRLKGGRAALRKAGNVVLAQARANAASVNDPKTPEEIAKNLVMRWSPRAFKRTGDLMFRVGILGGARRPVDDKAARKTERRRKRLGQASLEALGEIKGAGAGNPGGDTYYWRFLEFGTEKNPPQPFMRPVMAQVGTAPVDVFVKEYSKALDRAIKRQQKAASPPR